MLNHLKICHPDKLDADINYFSNLKYNYENRLMINQLFTKNSKMLEKGLLASYKISQLIAKSGKPHTIGESLILPAIKEVLNSMVDCDSEQIISSIPLSNSSVSSRIDEMAFDIEETLCAFLRTTKFSIQIDESTFNDSVALLLVYVRYINQNDVIQEEFLFSEHLELDTRGLTIFKTVEQYFLKHEIPLSNIFACSTDGAPAMVGVHRGFLAYMKEKVPNIFTIHCVIHRQHLAAKNLSERLNESLNVVICAINRIKMHPLNSRIFRHIVNKTMSIMNDFFCIPMLDGFQKETVCVDFLNCMIQS
ncbi:protein ZBED8-like [Octopus sinensis]|uniref:Protein ZBED8-like n=1 Tax=Octopus sinensis TaxID=2607531 RepID=A0A6P7U290_9MOLL|nr:protein ZBED8-like [Octopus sinensis]